MQSETTESLCAIVCSSDFNAAEFTSRANQGRFQFVIAVDGGYDWLATCGIAPNVLIGDFDSISAIPENLAHVEVVKFPAEKDASDFELAMEYATKAGFHRIEVYGGLGGRLDHTLGVLQVMARFAEQGLAITAIAPDYSATILRGPARLDLPASKGIVSVFSITSESYGVTEVGLKYSLDNATLSARETLGLSNELLGQSAFISLAEGTLVVFHPIAPC